MHLSLVSGHSMAKASTGRHAALQDFYQKNSHRPNILIAPMNRRCLPYWGASCTGKISCWATRLSSSPITGQWSSSILNEPCHFDRFIGMNTSHDSDIPFNTSKVLKTLLLMHYPACMHGRTT